MDVIEFLDNSGQVLVKRMPDDGQLEIKWGSQLTVQESQDAVFFRDGKALDVFSAGRFVLKTENIPLIGKWVTFFGYGPTSPFRAEVVFVAKQLFTNLKWGTRDPILFKDTDLQMVRLLAYGAYSMQVADSMLFVNKVVGTMGLFDTAAIGDYLRSIIQSKLNSVLGASYKSVFDLPASFDILNVTLRNALQPDFAGLGLSLVDFYVQSVTLPDEVQKMIDTRSELGAVGNLDNYMKFKVAQSIEDAANNTGAAGSAMSTGAGLAMGMAMPNYIQQSMQQAAPATQESATDKLKKLKELLDMGAISQQEFDSKKADLIKLI